MGVSILALSRARKRAYMTRKGARCKIIYRARKMAYNRLVGLEKGNCAFCGCFLMSAAGGFVYIYTRTRTRKGYV